jgi:DNA-binding PadR family transcriptional regulator
MPADLTSDAYWETSIIRSAGRMFMLASLLEEPRHGYDMARAIRQFCGGCCEPSDAMIYPGIRDLLAAGLITCEPETSGPRRRNVCSLTDRGREALRVAVEAWGRHLPAIERVMSAVERGEGVAVGVPAGVGGVGTAEGQCCPTESAD